MMALRGNIHPDARIGNNCDIHASAVVEGTVHIGNDVGIGAGVVVNGPCVVGDRCRVAAGCIIEPGRGSGQGVILESDVQLRAGAIVCGDLTIASGACIQPGAVIQRSVPPHAIVSGNPAQITGYASSLAGEDAAKEGRLATPPREPGAATTRVRGVTMHHLPRILDLRGNLSVGEFDRSVPFDPKRYFLVFGVPNAEVRGEHAHRTCKQFLVCVKGSCCVVADDGSQRQEFVLDDPAVGLYLPPLTWGIQYKYSADAVLLVFASEYYDTAEYIRDYGEFRRLAAGAG